MKTCKECLHYSRMSDSEHVCRYHKRVMSYDPAPSCAGYYGIGLDLLKSQAERAAKLRGHSIKWYDDLDQEWSRGICQTCGEWIMVETAPKPNGTDIGGPLVAAGCIQRQRAPFRVVDPMSGELIVDTGEPVTPYRFKRSVWALTSLEPVIVDYCDGKRYVYYAESAAVDVDPEFCTVSDHFNKPLEIQQINPVNGCIIGTMYRPVEG